MADRWIITSHKYMQHESLEAAQAERERLRKLVPKKYFYLHRIKTSQQASGAAEKIAQQSELLQQGMALATWQGATAEDWEHYWQAVSEHLASVLPNEGDQHGRQNGNRVD